MEKTTGRKENKFNMELRRKAHRVSIGQLRFMKQGQIRNVNVNELQTNVSHIVKDVEAGQIYRVMRYSQPAAVLIPYEDYENLRGNCQKCMGEVKESLRKLEARNPKS